MLDRCLDLLGARPRRAGRGARRRDARPRRPQRGAADQFPAVRLIGLDRDPRALKLARGAPGAVRRPGHLVHAVYDELPESSPASTGHSGQCPVRPRRVLHAAGRGRPRLRLRAGRPARHADGPDAPASPPRRSSTPTPPGELVRILRTYGEEKFAQRIVAAIVRERAQGTVHQQRAAGRADPRRDPAGDPSAPAATRPSARFQALRIEVNGELSHARGGDPGRPGRAGRRRPDRRAVLPLAGGPHRQAGLRRAGSLDQPGRAAGRAARQWGRPCACSPGARRLRPRHEIAANPRVGLGAVAGG